MITQSELKSYLSYNSDTGLFTWLVSLSNRTKIGKIAGSIYLNGYVYVGLLGKQHRAHRLAWFYVNGTWPKDQIDHINRVKHDNRISNLRESTCRKNARNRSDNFNKEVGVGHDKTSDRYIAKIRMNNKLIHLGVFEDLQSAIQARKEAEIRYNFYGETK